MYDTTAVRKTAMSFPRVSKADYTACYRKGIGSWKPISTIRKEGFRSGVNNVFKRSQQWDRSFVQGAVQKKITPEYELLLNAKYANDYMRYLNPNYDIDAYRQYVSATRIVCFVGQ